MAIEKKSDPVNKMTEKEKAAYRKVINDKIDEQIDQSFPASDPPSYSEPGNDDIKPGRQDIKKGRD